MSSKDKILWLAELMAEAKRIIDSESNILTALAETNYVGGEVRIHINDADLSEFGEIIKTPFIENREKSSVFINGVEVFVLSAQGDAECSE